MRVSDRERERERARTRRQIQLNLASPFDVHTCVNFRRRHNCGIVETISKRDVN